MATSNPATSPATRSVQSMFVTSKSTECDSSTLLHTPALLMPSEAKKTSPKGVQLPLSRIRTVMKCAPDVTNINQDCVVLMARATELFVEHFARQACNQATKEGRINIGYDDLGARIDGHVGAVHTYMACSRGGESCGQGLSYSFPAFTSTADAVQTDSFRLRFLNDVVPQKVLAKDALEYYYKKVGQDQNAPRKGQAVVEARGADERAVDFSSITHPDAANHQRLPEQ